MILRNNNGGIIDQCASLYVAQHVEEVTARSMLARYRLGLMLMHGLGARRYMPEAFKHFDIAAAHGDALTESHWC